MSWRPKAGDWVTGQDDLIGWNTHDSREVQPGQTYRVTQVGDQLVAIQGRNCAWLEWLRPATPEEIARAQLASLGGL